MLPRATCCICTDPFSVANVAALTCGHCFHLPCISYWLEANTTCPRCRTTVDKDTNLIKQLFFTFEEEKKEDEESYKKKLAEDQPAIIKSLEDAVFEYGRKYHALEMKIEEERRQIAETCSKWSVRTVNVLRDLNLKVLDLEKVKYKLEAEVTGRKAAIEKFKQQMNDDKEKIEKLEEDLFKATQAKTTLSKRRMRLQYYLAGLREQFNGIVSLKLNKAIWSGKKSVTLGKEDLIAFYDNFNNVGSAVRMIQAAENAANSAPGQNSDAATVANTPSSSSVIASILFPAQEDSGMVEAIPPVVDEKKKNKKNKKEKKKKKKNVMQRWEDALISKFSF